MKHRLAAALAGVVLLGAGIALAVGSLGDRALVSKSYYENTYLPALREGLLQRAQTASASTYDQAEKDLKEQNQAHLDQLQKQGGAQAVYVPLQLEQGDEFILEPGSVLLLQDGAGQLTAGALADVTDGTALAAGDALTPAHRCIVTGETAATLWQTASGGVLYQGTARVEQGAALTLPFADVTRDHWFYDAVSFVYRRGYFSGTGGDTFSPDAPMDRAMVATVLHRVSGGAPVTEGAAVFSDVPAGQWFSDGVAWASAVGVVNGMGEGLYAPQLPVTREQLVTMLYRYEKDYRQADLTAAQGGDLSAFPDGSSVSDWAREAMSWAVGEGLLQGRNTGELDPSGTATRAEVATILQRFSQRL